MSNILNKFRRKPAEPVKTESPALKREKTIPPHIVVCKVREGKGRKEGTICPQCKGTGRVIVSCEVTTYVSAYMPEDAT